MSPSKSGGPTTAKLSEALAELSQLLDAPLSDRQRRKLLGDVRELEAHIGDFISAIDPISQPTALFDPSNPKIVGRFVALALVAQERLPLEEVPKMYGSGVYAIYYKGSFDAYAPISGTETPIYVGTASPAISNARTPFEQGPKLSERVAYHARNIAKATTTLSLADFEFRFLVVQSGWEKQAEAYLIHLFKPVWNKETKIVSGFGKHGDSAEMRQHGRSPWDTLHPARGWAGESTSDQKPIRQIKAELTDHFTNARIYQGLNEVLGDFLEELRTL